MLRPCLVACLATIVWASDQAITYEGSSTVYPIIVAAGEAYREVNPRFTFTAKPTGSSAGYRAMLARSCSINGASRAINDKEMKAAADSSIAFVEIPLAYDAISLAANPRNTWLKGLTVAELRTLYAVDGPKTWKQLRADLPATPVVLYGPGKDSGTLDYFHEAVMGKDVAFRPDIVASEDDHMLVQAIAADVNAVGYMGLSYLIENSRTLRALAIDHGAGAILPTKESVLDGSYVPLSRPIFLYVRSEKLADANITGFVSFLLDHPDLIESVGYVPLPDHMRAEVKDRFAKRITGSLFSAVPVGTTLAQAMGVEAQAVAPATPVATPPVAATPASPTWRGPDATVHQNELERARAAAIDLARRMLEDGATLEELSQRSTELQQRIDHMAAAFAAAPRTPGHGLSLGEAASLTK